MLGDSNYLSQHFRQTASLGLLEAKGTSRLDVEVQIISYSQKCVCMGGRCLLPTRTWELEPSYTVIEEGHWKSLYQVKYTGVQAQCSHMLFPQPLPATNIRMLAATPTVRQDAGGFCPILSSHREACLEASCQLAAFLWQ